jgi:transportin-3
VVLSEGQISDITPVMHLIVVLQSRSSQIDPSLLHLVNKLNHTEDFLCVFERFCP